MFKNKLYFILFLLFSVSMAMADDATKFHGVCVGINNYPSGWPDLNNAVNDATEIRAALINHQGWNGDNICLLTDGFASEASIKTAISDMPRTSSNTCLFHFAGHGDSKELGAVWGWDGIDGFVPNEGGDARINPSELKTAFGSSYNKYCTFLDCCASGIFPRDINKGVITSAVKIDEIASDGEGRGNGLYSYYLIKGLKGYAADSYGTVTAEGLFYYAKPFATKDKPGTINDQNPQISDNYPGDLNLSTPPPPSVTIYPRANDRYTAVVRDGYGAINYKWWRRKDSLKGGAKAPPPGVWIYCSCWEDQSTITCPASWAFSLKCKVIDSWGRTDIDIISVPADKTILSLSQKEIFPNLSFTPGEITLGNNSPNPFNPSTTIRFGLPESQHVSIKIYSITGAIVKTLVNDYMSAGYHQARWNGRNESGRKLASGIYIYEMRSKNKCFVKKMLLAK